MKTNKKIKRLPTWCYLKLTVCPCVPQVESPLAVEAVLGEAPFSVTDEKVSILELRAHAISGLTLSLQPSPGNSHTMVAKATGLQTLTTPKQVRWVEVMRDAHENYMPQIHLQVGTGTGLLYNYWHGPLMMTESKGGKLARSIWRVQMANV